MDQRQPKLQNALNPCKLPIYAMCIRLNVWEKVFYAFICYGVHVYSAIGQHDLSTMFTLRFKKNRVSLKFNQLTLSPLTGSVYM